MVSLRAWVRRATEREKLYSFRRSSGVGASNSVRRCSSSRSAYRLLSSSSTETPRPEAASSRSRLLSSLLVMTLSAVSPNTTRLASMGSITAHVSKRHPSSKTAESPLTSL